MEKFFIVTPPGFEAETEREAREAWPFLLDASARPHAAPLPLFEPVIGGLTFEAEPFAALQLNFFLKTASRILWRLAEFRVRDFPKLHARLEKIDVRSRLGSEAFTVKAAASGSRLNHERRLEETARRAWKLKDEAPDADDSPAVFLRMDDDVCTVSLDTTGEHLHRRGVIKRRGEAPARETIAAFGLRTLIGETPPAELAHVTLIDPMMGSGTFPIEGMTLWRGSFGRTFRFQSFNGLPKLFRQPNFERNYGIPPAAPFGAFIGRDRDEKVVGAARINLEPLLKGPSSLSVDFGVQDLFSENARSDAATIGEKRARRWVICNPPYGERLAIDSPQGILDRVLEIWRPERVGFLWTESIARSLRWPAAAKVVANRKLKNGGLDAVFVVRDFSNML